LDFESDAHRKVLSVSTSMTAAPPSLSIGKLWGKLRLIEMLVRR